jgi:hypothetical protein
MTVCESTSGARGECAPGAGRDGSPSGSRAADGCSGRWCSDRDAHRGIDVVVEFAATQNIRSNHTVVGQWSTVSFWCPNRSIVALKYDWEREARREMEAAGLLADAASTSSAPARCRRS